MKYFDCLGEGDGMENRCLSKTFSSELYNVKHTVIEIMDFLQAGISNLSRNDYCELKLIYSELLINAVIHGNKNNAEKQVHMYTEILPDNTVVAQIADEGAGFDFSNLGSPVNCPLMEMEDHGRGICLVISLTDVFSFNEKGNEVVFRKKVNVNG